MAGDMLHLVIRQKINEGQFQAFKKMALEVTKGVEADEPDTWCYEWYVNEDHTEAFMFETYAKSEAFLLHMSHVHEALRSMPDVAPMVEVLVLGSPNAEVRDAPAPFKPRFLPLLVGCTRSYNIGEGKKGLAPDYFRVVINQGIDEGKSGLFKELAEELTAKVVAHDPGMLDYEWYPSDDGRDAWVDETYADSDSLTAHRARAWDTKYSILEVGPLLEALVFGSPNEEAREELSWIKPKYYSLLAGCRR